MWGISPIAEEMLILSDFSPYCWFGYVRLGWSVGLVRLVGWFALVRLRLVGSSVDLVCLGFVWLFWFG
jgi:hypothetical protein